MVITKTKGRKVLIQLQTVVDEEIKLLLNENYIEKMKDNQHKERPFSEKRALDARALKQAIAKDQYQPLNLENLLVIFSMVKRTRPVLSVEVMQTVKFFVKQCFSQYNVGEPT